MKKLQRPTVQELLVAALRTPLGNLVARPWFDHVALNTVAYWFFPLSRLWASARAAEGSVERFFDNVHIAPLSIGLSIKMMLQTRGLFALSKVSYQV